MDAAALRRGFRLGSWEVSPLEGTLRGPDGERRLRPKSMDVLVYLAGQGSQLAEREAILRAVWGHAVTDEPLTACIGELRRVLGDSRDQPEYIQTVPKRGYRLLAEATPLEPEATAAAPVREVAPLPDSPPLPEPSAAGSGPVRVPIMAELRERSVVRIAAVYVAAAALLWFATARLPAVAPGIAGRSLPLLLLLLLPACVLGGWFFGIVRGVPTRRRASANTDAIVVFAALWVVASLAWFSALPQTIDASRIGLAVLPFANLSDEPGTEYFSDGIAEELLNRLGRLDALRVPSRASSFAFRDERPGLRAIGDRLGVGYVLDGSVRRAGLRVRIAVELVAVETDSRVWSQVYDAELGDVFQLQADIARQVAAALKIALNVQDEQRLARRPTNSIDAYDVYLLGRQRLYQRTVPALREAVTFFQQAHELDRAFAPAYAGLAEAYEQLGRIDPALTAAEASRRAERAVSAALALDPELPAALAADALQRYVRGDFATAREVLERAYRLAPNDPLVIERYGSLLTELGEARQGRAVLERGIDRDPASPTMQYALALNELALDEIEPARERLERLARADPPSASAAGALGDLYWRELRQPVPAIDWLERAVQLDPGNVRRHARLAAVHLDAGDPGPAAEWLDRGFDRVPDSPVLLAQRAQLDWYLGQRSSAVAMAEQALAREPRNELALAILHASARRAGALDGFAERLEAAYPELAGPKPALSHRNMRAALRLAAALADGGGDAARVRALARALEPVVRAYPRRGRAYDLVDVQLAVIAGDTAEAMRALERAVDRNWGAGWWWYLGEDPLLDPLRALPRFAPLMARVAEGMRLPARAGAR